MTNLNAFLFENEPVRGVVLRIQEPWQEIIKRRQTGDESFRWNKPIEKLMGELTAAAVLMHSSIEFGGTLLLQIQGENAVKLAVVEVGENLSIRTTAKIDRKKADKYESFAELINKDKKARCAITLIPSSKEATPYQSLVPLINQDGQVMSSVSEMIEHYMSTSEQISTTIQLAANEEIAAGILIQKMPIKGEINLEQEISEEDGDDAYQRISMLTKTLKNQELLELDSQTILHRLYWEDDLLQHERIKEQNQIHFHCSCSRERIASMIKGLGIQEAEDILKERNDIEVDCEFCGKQEKFDAIDIAEIFTPDDKKSPDTKTNAIQ